jgi:hypothetical protein
MYNPNQGTTFQKPENQFVVRFVGRMYQFLLNEFPPDEHQYSPQIRYYTIIAQILLKTHYFREPQKDENIAVRQVANWHNLFLSH